MTDITKLKELAERATPGRNFDRLPSAGGGLKYTCTGDDDSLVLRVDHKNGEFGFIGPKGDEDEAFFLACTPKAVLELIAEVERLNEELSACTEHPGGCGYWREAAKLREAERDKIQAEVERFKDANREISETNTRRRDENVRLKAENAALRQFAAEAYQVLGALDAPENVLDNASDAANGAPLRHETLLPFFAEDYEALRKDAERYRWLRANNYDIGSYHPTHEHNASAWFEHLEDFDIDAALEGGGR